MGRAVTLLMLAVALATATGWVKTYNGGYGADLANAIVLTPAGVPYVTGSITGSDWSDDLVTVRYNPTTGESTLAIWYYRSGFSEFADEGKAVAVGTGDTVFVTGLSTDSIIEGDTEDADTFYFAGVTTLKYNSNLNLQASDRIVPYSDEDEEPSPSGRAVATRGNRAYVAAEGYWSYNRAEDVLAVRYGPSGRDTAWCNGAVGGSDAGNAVAVDADGNCFIAGSVRMVAAHGLDFIVLKYKYDSTFDREWVAYYNWADSADEARALALGAGGRVFATGPSKGLGTGYDYATVCFTSDGVQSWARRYATDSADVPVAMAVSPQGYLYVTGTSKSASTGNDFLTIRYNPADGSEVWVRRFDANGGSDEAAAIAVDFEGSVYVAGYATRSGTGQDFCIVKYTQSGALDTTWYWNDASNGTDVATSIAVDSARNVYVTGYGQGTNGFDIVTMRIEQPVYTDVGIEGIISPGDTEDYGELVVPSATVFADDSTNLDDSVWVVMRIGTFYSSTRRAKPAAGQSVTVVFDTWPVQQPGYHYAVCSLDFDDDNEANNRAEKLVTVPPGWKEVAHMPAGPQSPPKLIKAGGWLTYNAGDSLLYGAKGNKTNEFYAYVPNLNKWSSEDTLAALETIPHGAEGKLPSKGAAACSDGDGHIYATKGNNTQGFWCYHVAEDSWEQLENVPLGTSGKKVKGGTDVAFVSRGDTDFVYLLKGYKNEFYRYNVPNDTWQTLTSAPAGSPKYDKGSWLVFDGDSLLYCHQAKYHAYHRYNLNSQSWGSALTGMPTINRFGRKKKSKDGGSAAWLGNSIYSLKGGNTQEFWKYVPASDSWAELDTLPQFGYSQQKKRVKDGGDITTDGAVLYALKGNKTLELWRYVPSGSGTPPGTENSTPPGEYELQLAECENASWPCFSQDGLWAAWVAPGSNGHDQLFRVPSDASSSAEELTSFSDGDATGPIGYSSDDTKIAIVFEADNGGSKVMTVPSGGGQPTTLVSDKGDIEDLAWFPGNALVFSLTDTSDFTQLWSYNLTTSSLMRLTSSCFDHHEPHPVTDTLLVFRLDCEPAQVAKLYARPDTNPLGGTGNFAYVWCETCLTQSAYEHAVPCPTSTGSVLYEVETEGYTAIGQVSIDGTGEQTILSDPSYDLVMPTVEPMGDTAFCIRLSGQASAVCVFEPGGSGYELLTDDKAERETPSARAEPSYPSSAVYMREDGIYRTRGQGEGGAQGSGLGVFALDRIAPNPSRGRVGISWQVPRLAQVSLKLFDPTGRLVRTLESGERKPGRYVAVWDGTDAKGRSVATGLYFARLRAAGQQLTRKLVLQH